MTGPGEYEILCELRDKEEGFYFFCLGEDFIVLMRKTGENGMGLELLELDLQGNESFRGELPLDIPECYALGWRDLECVCGTRDKLLICINDSADGKTEKSRFLKYDIEDGVLTETLLGENESAPPVG
ncbi:MAG: hypothetical protein J5586_00655 [Clostridia bacterium]|nr:hypothetical protein [Clostridia bacterium]